MWSNFDSKYYQLGFVTIYDLKIKFKTYVFTEMFSKHLGNIMRYMKMLIMLAKI